MKYAAVLTVSRKKYLSDFENCGIFLSFLYWLIEQAAEFFKYFVF